MHRGRAQNGLLLYNQEVFRLIHAQDFQGTDGIRPSQPYQIKLFFHQEVHKSYRTHRWEWDVHFRKVQDGGHLHLSRKDLMLRFLYNTCLILLYFHC